MKNLPKIKTKVSFKIYSACWFQCNPCMFDLSKNQPFESRDINMGIRAGGGRKMPPPPGISQNEATEACEGSK